MFAGVWVKYTSHVNEDAKYDLESMLGHIEAETHANKRQEVHAAWSILI